jgi:outer membrane lipoprotein SlyB
VEEVERGIEMGRGGGESKERIVGGSVSGGFGSESKENVVLESRVEIIVEGDDESERNVLDEWDGWSAGVGQDLDQDDEERGRKGMSLPRREW